MLIETRGLTYKYGDGNTALDNVNFKAHSGKFIMVLGANGSGKTTLFKHFNGLHKPTKGKVLLKGEEIQKLPQKELYRLVGMVFQDPNDQLFASTVREDVSFGPANLGLDHEEVKERVNEALAMVGALELADKPIHHLSFGQKKRVAIAGVVAMGPEVIVLDEPTAGLDPGGIKEIMDILLKLNKEKGITIIMATHDVDLVPLYADEVYILYKGRVLLSGTPDEVFKDKGMIRDAKLRQPRVAHLAEILKEIDLLPLDGKPLTIGQARREILKILKNCKDEKNNPFSG